MSVLFRATAGLIVWAVGFSLIYGIHGIACARRWDAIGLGLLDLHRWSMLAAWGATILVGAWLAWSERHGGGFAGDLARIGAIVGLVATIVTGLPALVFPACV